MYLLLITNRASNIVEDLETLRLLSKVVPSVTGSAGTLAEDKLLEKSLDILFAFDEVISVGGHREALTLQQIKLNTEMESHEEKLHNMIKLSKMESAKDQAQQAAKAIKDRQRQMGSVPPPASSYAFDAHTPPSAPSPSSAASSPAPPPSSSSSQRGGVKGMSLGGAGKTRGLEDALIKEDKIVAPLASSRTAGGSTDSAPSAGAVQVSHPVMLTAVEKVSARLSREGLVESLEVKGALTLTALDDDAANCVIRLRGSPSTGRGSSFAFTTHPKINKVAYEKSGVLQLKDQGKGGFPSGRPVGILKWTNSVQDEALLPLKINCWPEDEGRGVMSVSIEYSLELSHITLHDVRIHIPLGTTATPSVHSVDGTYRLHSASQELIWELSMIDSSNSSGSLEFSVGQKSSDAFFPIAVHFASQQLFVDMDVQDVAVASSGNQVQFGYTKALSSEEYLIG